jgi:hypothetical protein
MSYLCIIVLISKKNSVGKGLKIVRYKTLIKKHSQALNQSLKSKEKIRKEIKKKEEDVEDVEAAEDVEDVEFANQFNDSMNISPKRRRVEDV